MIVTSHQLSRSASVTSVTVYSLCPYTEYGLKVIPLTSTEAEHVALADLVCELLFLTGLLTEMGYPQRPVGVDEDNTGVFGIARNEGKYAHRRHINIKYHLCQKFLGSLYFLRDVKGSDNVADLMTKSIFTGEKFVGYRDQLLTPL